MGKKATVPDNVDDDDALDMFAENLDGDKKKEEVAAAPVKEDPVLDDVSLGVNRFLYMFRGRSRWAGSLSGSLRMWNCMGLTPVKRCLTGRWETLNDSLTWIYTLFFPLRILTIQKSSHSISPGVWLLWRGDSRQKSWHRGVQGFKEDWFWALCLASFSASWEYYALTEEITLFHIYLLFREMNAPPTFESFLLYDGEKKITREQDTKVPVSSNAIVPFQFLSLTFWGRWRPCPTRQMLLINNICRVGQGLNWVSLSFANSGAQCSDLHHQQGGPHHWQYGTLFFKVAFHSLIPFRFASSFWKIQTCCLLATRILTLWSTRLDQI